MKWYLKRFKDFEAKAGDVIAAILETIRYTEPLKNYLNRTRWPMYPIWQVSLKTAFKALEPPNQRQAGESVKRFPGKCSKCLCRKDYR
jgi:hypothetical protein